jgi:hypothetical protein
MDILVIVIFGFFITIYSILLTNVFNQEIEKIATYYYGEPLLSTVWNILSSYVFLTPFVFIAIFITLIYYGTDSGSAAIIAQIGTIELLIMMRFLLNPTWDYPFIKPKPNESFINAIKSYKERMHSMFFSFISLFWIIIVLFFIAIMANWSYEIESRFIPQGLDGMQIFAILFSYTISLLIFTLCSEWMISRWMPIEQTFKNT